MNGVRLLVCFTGLALLGGHGTMLSAEAPQEAKRPNFLIILADDLGFSDLGCYGGEIATPNLDKLAGEGLRFTQFYNTARCWPSRGALMTGYYAQSVRRDVVPGVKSGSRGVRPSWAPLMSEFLRSAGYRTYHSGKWHIDGDPLANGFDHSYVIGGGQNNYFKTQGIAEDGSPVEQRPGFYVTTAIAEHAIKCLREHAEKFKDRPFFHYLAFTSPHFPLQAPQDEIDKYRDTYRIGWNAIAAARHERLVKLGIAMNALPQMERDVGPPYDFPKAIAQLGPAELNRPIPWTELNQEQKDFQAQKMAIHAAMVDRMDQEIGRVLSQLKQMGAYKNTVVFFASDNGASAEMMIRGDGHDPAAQAGSAATFLCLGPGWSSAANTPFRRHKTWVHEGGISTPLIVNWPEGIKAHGELRRTPGHVVDILPTILELSGTQKPSVIQGQKVPDAPGRSLVPSFGSSVASLHDYLWWEHEKNCAIRSKDWKLVKDAKSNWALYDLARDRGESRDLSTTYPEKVKELQTLWQAQAEKVRSEALSDVPAKQSAAE